MRELKPEEYFQVSGGNGKKIGHIKGIGKGHHSHGNGHGYGHNSHCTDDEGGGGGGGGGPEECGPGHFWGPLPDGTYGCVPF